MYVYMPLAMEFNMMRFISYIDKAASVTQRYTLAITDDILLCSRHADDMLFNLTEKMASK